MLVGAGMIKKPQVPEQGKFCPNCGSANLKIVETPALIESALFQYYKCADCGYEGPVVIGGVGMQRNLKKNFGGRKLDG